MNAILLIILSFTLLFILQNIINNKTGISDVMNKVNNDYITNKFNDINDKKKNITETIKKRSKRKVDYEDPFYKFPDPMLSTISHALSDGYKPLNDNTNVVNNKDSVDIIRNNGFDYYKNRQIYFDPFNIRRDTMDADPGKFTKQGLAKTWDGEETLIKATSDEYLTKYPDYASYDITNQLTNVGYLYDNDENNKYINLKNKILPSNCTLNDDELECEFNGKLQPIPKELMNNNSNVLNSIGVITNSDDLIKSVNDFSYDDVSGGVYKSWKYENEKSLNGGFVYDNIMGSESIGNNETYMLVDNNLNCDTCAI